MSTIASMLPGAPGNPSAGKWSAAGLYGLNPGAGSKAAGQSLPASSAAAGDNAHVPWSPDSPVFWLLVISGATVLGITGASVKVRAFKRAASVNLGDA